MHLKGDYIINCPRTAAWKFISNPREIAQCLPDLQRLDVKDSTHFAATLKVGMAFVRGSFKFDFALLDQSPPSHSRFDAAGKGAGVSIRLQAEMDLHETGSAETQVSWKCDVVLGGLLGEISPSLIQGSADRFTREFFSCIKNKLESRP